MATSTDAVLPHLPVNIRNHVRPIAIQFAILILSTSALPIMLYFVLKNAANATPPVFLGIATLPFAVGSLTSWFTRLYRLTSKKHANQFLPLGATSRWRLDFFQWDFTASFLGETVIISISVSLPPRTEHPFTGGVLPRLSAFAIVFLIANLSVQLVLANLLVLARLRNPCAISSVAKGEPTRPALYTIIEDVVAVDAKQGRNYRDLWDQRYRDSPNGMMRKLLLDMGWIWGISGICFAGLMAGIIFPRNVVSHATAYALGFSLPWAWISLMALFTFWFVPRRLELEWAEASRRGTGSEA